MVSLKKIKQIEKWNTSILKGQIKKYNEKEKDEENVEEIDRLCFNLFSVDISVKQKKHFNSTVSTFHFKTLYHSLNSKEKYK